MFLSRQIKVKRDNAAEILATEDGRIYSKRDLGVVIDILVESAFGTRGTTL